MLLAGRDFTEADREGAPKVAIINQTMARYFFGDGNPIGKRIDASGGSNYDCAVIGVVRDVKHLDLKEGPQRVFYVPYAQSPDFLQRQNMILELRTSAAPTAVAKQVRELISEIDRNVLIETETLKSHVDGSLARERLLAMLSGFLGTLSLLLAAIGLYGVMAYAVVRRTGEIGLRMALGAQPGRVLRMVLRDGFALVLTGACIGVATAYAVSHVIGTFLFGITSRDSVSFALAVVALALAALVATIIPARRAAKVDPMVALRYE
jgi:putative ABC transport system permease protein